MVKKANVSFKKYRYLRNEKSYSSLMFIFTYWQILVVKMPVLWYHSPKSILLFRNRGCDGVGEAVFL